MSFKEKKIIVSLEEWEAAQKKLKKLESELEKATAPGGTVKIVYGNFGSIHSVSYKGPIVTLDEIASECRHLRDVIQNQDTTIRGQSKKIRDLRSRGLLRRLFNLDPK